MTKIRSDVSLPKLVPSLALLAAVSRHGSFAAAALDLGLDPSAVSHRIRGLETLLGLTLFDRTTRSVRPNRAGTLLCAAATRSLDDVEHALNAMKELRSEKAIRLSVHSSLAMKWLIPRLPDAQRAGLDLSLDVREGLASFDTGDADAGFRFGPGPYPGLHATRLSKCQIQPVIGASYPGANLLRDDALRDGSIPILADRGAEKLRTGTTWEDYWTYLGLDAGPTQPSQNFDRADLMLQGAIGGLGIALGRSLLIEDDIRDGLLRPIGEPVRAPSDYWLVTTAELANSDGILLLRDWLKEQISLTSQLRGEHST